jgi:activator of HSP90 ATPase
MSPHILFETYMDSKKHSSATNSGAYISRRAGKKFSAYGGYIKGKHLLIVQDRLIGQSWRGSDWKNTELDSTLILTFSKSKTGSKLEMVQVNVPDHSANEIKKGWTEYNWQPWRLYFNKMKVRQ